MNDMETARASAIVSGMVQGVFFRASTVETARKIGGLTGWVKNLPNGWVEVICEGERANVEKLLEWLKNGPPSASVQDVKVIWDKATGEFFGFNVCY